MSSTEPAGGAPPTTATPPTRTPSAAPTTTSSPTLPSPAPGRGGRRTTVFNRTPAESTPTRPTIRDAAQAHKTRPGAPTAEQRVADDATAARSAGPTSNDGRADGGVRTDNHRGNRDQQIRELQANQERIEGEQADIADEIDRLESDIDRIEGRSGKVGAVVDVATAPVTLVAGLLGKSNPIGDAAESVSDRVQGIQSRIDDLEDRQTALDRTEARIAREVARLEQERTLNFLTDVAYVTNMPNSVADALDGAGEVQFRVVSETGLGSDAAYSSGEKQIVIDDAVIDRVTRNFDELREAGIVDQDGNIVDAEAFDESVAGDAAIGSAVLLGVHEVTHAAQDQLGVFDEAYARVDAVRDTDGPEAAEALRVSLLEYDAYVNQETVELRAGKVKQGFITINPDGSLLPREQAEANIFQFQLGLPLLHGPSAGETFTGVVAGQARGVGSSETPGRRSPGEDAPGRRSPGEDAPGRRSPGDYAPGRRSPGDYAPGRRSPGDYAPGRRSPGEDAPGRRSPGDYAPGRRSPGDFAPGRRSPGDFAPGRRSPGSETA